MTKSKETSITVSAEERQCVLEIIDILRNQGRLMDEHEFNQAVNTLEGFFLTGEELCCDVDELLGE